MMISREDVAAFADGELAGARESEIAAAISADPELQRQVEAHRALKGQLSQHFTPIAEEPVPDRLSKLLTSGHAEVVDLSAARKQRAAKRTIPRWGWVAGPALAASLALAVFLPRDNAPEGYADAQLAGILESQLVADQEVDAETRILLSFRDSEGEFCRAFSGSGRSGIACRDTDGWKLEALGKGSQGAETEYRMAGATDADILAQAQRMADGPALDAQAEAQARDSGWR